MNKLILLTATACVLVTPALGQIYLIAGSPTPKYGAGYATVLASVGADGAVKTVQEIVPSNVGTEWTTTSYEARKAVVLSKDPDSRVIVVDFDTTSVSKSCRDPDGTGLVGQWLVDPPSKGLMFVGLGTSKATRMDDLLGMAMAAGEPCGSSFATLDNSDLKYLISDGLAGIVDLGSYDSMDVRLGSDGSLTTQWLSGEPTYFDYKVPVALFSDMKQPNAMILFNNREILGLELTDPPNGRLVVFRKSDSTWHQVPEPSPGRAFGSFVGSSENHIKGASMPESAGKGESRPGGGTTGPSALARLNRSRAVYPGILHLYDAAAERAYTITTNQGDSEILLVESGTVYYRVINRLYSVTIEGDALGAPKLLATDDLIEDAHWAFIKH